ncbi:hypothetical protein E2P63_04505 [Candidatus Bathyarchaeota archaeon]|nr:hypothetical protein E2P63_04505 [Candidatus Bathyarchaeota archaeon]
MKDWSVAVFRVKPENIKNTIVNFYRFVEDLEGVVSLHFLIRDRLDDYVVFSFRVLSEPDKLKIVSSKMKYKLYHFQIWLFISFHQLLRRKISIMPRQHRFLSVFLFVFLSY